MLDILRQIIKIAGYVIQVSQLILAAVSPRQDTGVLGGNKPQ